MRLHYNLRHMDLWCLHDYLWASMMSVMKFGFEMDPTSWLTTEVNLNPFFSWTVLGKYRKWHVCFSN